MDYPTQVLFRAHIEGKLVAHREKFGNDVEKGKMEMGGILGLFKKLREAIVASKRVDEFAIEGVPAPSTPSYPPLAL